MDKEIRKINSKIFVLNTEVEYLTKQIQKINKLLIEMLIRQKAILGMLKKEREND